ncbi:MAG: GNAT family N-acetyltransferase [Armatimonadota bacterium]|nr:MAG: GNAT family N-acetyltransferase [Armatimonadota bacterium]
MMGGTVEMCRLMSGDEKTACDIVKMFKSREVEMGHMAAFLAEERNYLIAAHLDQQPVGFALAYELPRVDGPKPMMLFYEIEVAEAHRRRGIGKALVEHLKRICEERGCAKMFVVTSESNVAAMALYVSTGGKRPSIDEAMFEYGPPWA